jgi:hypothetical protein
MNSFYKVMRESTCKKRVTICEIYDIDNNLLSRESNRCNPDNGVCARLGVIQSKENYDVHSHCNWTHAEINAIKSLPLDCKPHKIILYGHNFLCDNCEQELRKIGVVDFEISPMQIN